MGFSEFKRELPKLNFAIKANYKRLRKVEWIADFIGIDRSSGAYAFMLWASKSVELVDKSLVDCDSITMTGGV